MKQFNLEEYLKNPSKRVVTRDGRKARIICTDAKGKYPIVALIETFDGTIEDAYGFKKNGHAYEDDADCPRDLFFVSKKLEGWVNLYKDVDNSTYPGNIYDSKAEAKKEIDKNDDYVTTIKIEWEE